jgi:hypothetical protein
VAVSEAAFGGAVGPGGGGVSGFGVAEVAGPAFVFLEVWDGSGGRRGVRVGGEARVFGLLGGLLDIFELISMEGGLTHKEYNLIRASVCITKIKLSFHPQM